MKKTTLLLLSLVIAWGAWCQQGSYKVYAVRFASVPHPMAISFWADKGPTTDSVNIDFMVWLIKGNGKNILVDAGFLREIPEAKGFGVVYESRPDSALQKLSIKAEDITDIILSHPHWDHIDGIGLFPNAHIWIQKDDYNYYTGAAWQKDGQNGGFTKRDVRMLVDLNLDGKVTLVDGDDKEIIPGIKVYTGSRHTFNSQYVVVATGTNKVLLASDNIWIYYSLEHMVPASKGGTLDPAGYVRSMQRMKTLVSDPKFIIPGHDAQVFSKFPRVTEGVVQIE
ncbi:MAG TPA: N-acyl homoserine lactonase family protein [Puia sp.]|jgi:glyoxylase-like metal-dependent hydrolase (beta-lactamase superfamily II)|nr:N-acyl homoserine lactonase family protein [Puia sp.]